MTNRRPECDDAFYGQAEPPINDAANAATSAALSTLLPSMSAQAQFPTPRVAQLTNAWTSPPFFWPSPFKSPEQVQTRPTAQKPPVSENIPPVIGPVVGPASCWPMVPPSE